MEAPEVRRSKAPRNSGYAISARCKPWKGDGTEESTSAGSVTPAGVLYFRFCFVPRSFASLRSGLYSVALSALRVNRSASPGLRGDLAVVRLFMRTLTFRCVAGLFAAGMLAGAALADKPNDRSSENTKPDSGEAVFVTGSLIPQRIKLKPLGTTTVSPIRIIDRHEIDTTGRRTTRGVLIADPSVRALGH